MSKHCSLRSGGLTREFFSPKNVTELSEFLSDNSKQVLFIGLGSNLLIRDHGFDGATIGGAVALAIGIGIQNFPEGFAVAMPLRRLGVSRKKSFWYGQLSAIVEPIAAVVGALAVTFFTPLLPYALAFAAGAMIFVVVEEVIPETQRDKYTDIATLGFIGGFIVMMTLDVALG